jgi:hypothetical protein
MKNSKFLLTSLVLIGLFVLTASSATHMFSVAGASASPNPLAPAFPAPSVSPSSSENATTYSYSFDSFGKTYTAYVTTNTEVSNLTISKSGLGIQFQASVPSGTTGFFNVTVPDILLGTNVAVIKDNVPLVENISYTKVHIGTDYLFHLEYEGGTATIAVEAASLNLNPPPQSQSAFPTETLVVVGAVGAVAAIGAAVAYAFKGAIFHKAGALAGKGAISAAGAPSGGGGGGAGAGAGGFAPAQVSVGANILVHPHPAVGLTFSLVKAAGAATAIPLLSYPALPQGLKFLGTVFDIKTTAVFTGAVLVALAFDGKDMTEEQKKKLRVYRNDLKKDSVWEDVTSSIDTKKNVAYGSTDHFSGFGVH